jgi:hypothetical protein
VGLAVFSYFIIGNSALWRRLVSHMERSKFQVFAVRLCACAVFLILLVAFNIGMFRSAGVSVDVLKCGFAVINGFLVLIFIIIISYTVELTS